MNGQELPPREEIAIPTPAYQRYLDVKKETNSLMEKKDWDGLEALAKKLRESKESLDAGTWLLSIFYKELDKVPLSSMETEAETMNTFKDWVHQRPESVVAKVALAEAYITWAWNARGSDYAHTVSEEGWTLMKERLDLAWKSLESCKEAAATHPEWTAVAQRVALGQSWDRTRYMTMMNSALAREPGYGEYYTQLCYWLLPRWHGESGDFEQWISQRVHQFPEAEQDQAYARMVWFADRMNFPEEIVFAQHRLDWSKTKRGFEQWLKNKPDNLMVRFQFLRLALKADDRNTTREQFDHLGGIYWPGLWKGINQYEAARQYAYHSGPNPFLPKPSAQNDKREKQNITAYPWLKTIILVFGRTVAGLILALCIFLLLWQSARPGLGLVLAALCVGLSSLFGPHGNLPLLAVVLFFWIQARPKSIASDNEASSPEGFTYSPILTLLWVLGLGAVFLLFQIFSTTWLMLPQLLGFPAEASFVLIDIQSQVLVSSEIFWSILLSQILLLLLLLWVCGLRQNLHWIEQLGLLPASFRTLGFCVLLGVGLQFLMALIPESFWDQKSVESSRLISSWLTSSIVLNLSVIIFAPLVEELLFRGFALSSWLKRWPVWVAVLLSSSIFAALHLQYGWTALLSIFSLGLLLALCRLKTGSVLPCIALHLGYNAAHVITQWLLITPYFEAAP
ncbi:MAG: CPBP family intramembrane metalloprotease [Blastochloris sp.]|nr:CPBP family intramembrane metalloprotease [Blastochloris sp.]